MRVGDLCVFLRYRPTIRPGARVFEPGYLIVATEKTGDVSWMFHCVDADGAYVPGLRDQLHHDEFVRLKNAPMVSALNNAPILLPHGRTSQSVRTPRQPQTARVTWPELEAIFLDPSSKKFTDLRDRAAHLYLTGGYATNLRQFFSGALCVISSTRDGSILTDPQTGAIQVAEEVVQRLALDDHLMVKAVRKMQAEGWRMRRSLGPNKRRPYTKVFMYRGEARITVQLDGSMLDHWPYSGRSR